MGAPALVGALAIAVSACQQVDQELPFELDGGAGQTVSVGVSGGLVSVPPSFSIQFPSGSLPGVTSVTAAPRASAFPATGGPAIPGTAFDVGPAGLALSVPARVQIAVASSSLAEGDELRLAVALLQTGGSVVTDVSTYDLSNGILTAYVSEVGPVAAVLSPDVIPVLDVLALPNLGGGSISPPIPAPLPVGPAQAPGDPEFTAECSGEARNCLTSGIVQIWVNDVVRDRLGDDMVLANTTIDGYVAFLDFISGLPTRVLGWIDVEGDLRTRLNNVVAGRSVGDELYFQTGPEGFPPAPTNVTFNGNVMTLAETSDGFNDVIVYGVTGIGTGEQVTVRLEGDIEFENPTEVGQVVVHIKLRR